MPMSMGDRRSGNARKGEDGAREEQAISAPSCQSPQRRALVETASKSRPT